MSHLILIFFKKIVFFYKLILLDLPVIVNHPFMMVFYFILKPCFFRINQTFSAIWWGAKMLRTYSCYAKRWVSKKYCSHNKKNSVISFMGNFTRNLIFFFMNTSHNIHRPMTHVKVLEGRSKKKHTRLAMEWNKVLVEKTCWNVTGFYSGNLCY